MSADDKYPAESGRRRFVKGVVGSATLASVGTASAAAVGSATSSSGAGGGLTTFFGIENTAGPAPRGMPQIPLTIDDQGALKGVWPEVETVTESGREIQVAETEIAGETYSSEWFQYCGVQTYKGIQPSTEQDNFFRAASGAPYEWQSDIEAGAKLTVDMFDDYQSWGNDIGRSGVGKPAMATWRSVDLPPQETLPVQVLRSERIKQMAQGDSQYAQWLQATTEQGFIAWLNKCTHFCCVPGFKTTAQAARFDAENDVYCPCHQSVYDPFSIVQKSFVALPRPESD